MGSAPRTVSTPAPVLSRSRSSVRTRTGRDGPRTGLVFAASRTSGTSTETWPRMTDYNPFIELHELKFGTDDNRFGTGWENHLTEALAFFLRCDSGALTNLCRGVLGADFEEPLDVETQVGTDRGVPDIRIPLRSGRD